MQPNESLNFYISLLDFILLTMWLEAWGFKPVQYMRFLLALNIVPWYSQQWPIMESNMGHFIQW